MSVIVDPDDGTCRCTGGSYEVAFDLTLRVRAYVTVSDPTDDRALDRAVEEWVRDTVMTDMDDVSVESADIDCIEEVDP